jgi:hypothetical protein
MTDIARLRRDVGANVTSLPDADANALFVEAAETYSNAASAAAYTRALAIQGLLASSAKLVSYRQNQSSENASDVFEHLTRLLSLWEQKTADAQKLAGNGAARFGATGKKPTRIREYPNS